jgi:hypothetical protein
VPRSQRGRPLRPYSRISRPQPLLFLPSSSSIPLFLRKSVAPGIEQGPLDLQPGTMTARPQTQFLIIIITKVEFIGDLKTVIKSTDKLPNGWSHCFLWGPQIIREGNISWEVGAMIKPSCAKHMSASIRELPCTLPSLHEVIFCSHPELRCSLGSWCSENDETAAALGSRPGSSPRCSQSESSQPARFGSHVTDCSALSQHR